MQHKESEYADLQNLIDEKEEEKEIKDRRLKELQFKLSEEKRKGGEMSVRLAPMWAMRSPHKFRGKFENRVQKFDRCSSIVYLKFNRFSISKFYPNFESLLIGPLRTQVKARELVSQVKAAQKAARSANDMVDKQKDKLKQTRKETRELTLEVAEKRKEVAEGAEELEKLKGKLYREKQAKKQIEDQNARLKRRFEKQEEAVK